MAGFENNEIALHPGMNVAFDRNELFMIVGVGESGCAGRLHFVPFAIDLGERMDVVGERVAIRDVEFLTDAKGEDMGRVVAALLIKGCGSGRGGSIVTSSGRDVDDHVAKRIIGTGDHIFREKRIGGVHPDALRLFREIEGFGFGRGARKADSSADGSATRGST
jgi:hypothetical protein